MNKKYRDIMLALAVYIFKTPFCFSGMVEFEGDVVHTTIMKDAQMISEGKEGRVMDNIMNWVRNIRAQALQDLARDFPQGFRRCWMIILHEH